MSYSFTVSETSTFTLTHAKHMGAKVATDLKRLQRFYDQPSDADIASYEGEVVALLKADYLDTVAYGFWRNGNWIEPTLKYTARDLAGSSANDDDPGKVRPGANIADATFYSYLTRNAAWHALSSAEREAFDKQLPVNRGTAAEPGITGYLADDRTYSSGGRALNRASVRSFG